MQLLRFEALAILTRCELVGNEDFHSLYQWKVDALLREAKERRYRKPKNANGSTARYFYTYLQRRIAVKPRLPR